MIVCRIDETQQEEAPLLESLVAQGLRTLALGAYDIGAYFYGRYDCYMRSWPSPVHWVKELGCLCWYAVKHPSRKRRVKMKVAEMVAKWKEAVVRLAVAHDKEEADRVEASIEELLTPLLSAPCKDIRQFAALLAAELMNDPKVPYLVWRAFEVWTAQMDASPDQEVKELKEGLAREIVEMVEKDAREQLPDAMIRALMWRSPERLEEVKAVVAEEKAAGRKVKLAGKESCLFLVAAEGTDREVCVQI